MIDKNIDRADISFLLEAAISMHELYLNFIDAGFSVDESLKLIAYMVTTSKKEKDEE